MLKEKLSALPREIPDYHERQAAHYRALAESATTQRVKARLIRAAEEYERLTEGDCAASQAETESE